MERTCSREAYVQEAPSMMIAHARTSSGRRPPRSTIASTIPRRSLPTTFSRDNLDEAEDQDEAPAHAPATISSITMPHPRGRRSAAHRKWLRDVEDAEEDDRPDGARNRMGRSGKRDEDASNLVDDDDLRIVGADRVHDPRCPHACDREDQRSRKDRSTPKPRTAK